MINKSTKCVIDCARVVDGVRAVDAARVVDGAIVQVDDGARAVDGATAPVVDGAIVPVADDARVGDGAPVVDGAVTGIVKIYAMGVVTLCRYRTRAIVINDIVVDTSNFIRSNNTAKFKVSNEKQDIVFH